MRILYFILVVSFLISSCSTPKRSITYRKKKVRKTRVERVKKPQYASIRDAIILEAEKYLGTPYRYGGKSPRAGLDCSGLVSYVFNKQGLSAMGASHHQAKMGAPKSKRSLEPGDLVFFGKNGKISHVSIVYRHTDTELLVIHSTSSSGVKIDEINSSRYWNGLYLFGRDIISEHEALVAGGSN